MNIIKRFFTIKKVVNIESVEVSQWLPIKYVETTWDEILIKNEKGWIRTCICLAKRNGKLKLYDHNETEIKGFNATHFMKINKPINDKDYAIALARHFNVKPSDL
jgi:hypothetical protein